MSDDALDDRLHTIEQAQPGAFDLLLQATYTGYYRHPKVSKRSATSSQMPRASFSWIASGRTPSSLP